jgi:hypothetical protein
LAHSGQQALFFCGKRQHDMSRPLTGGFEGMALGEGLGTWVEHPLAFLPAPDDVSLII